MSILKDAPLLEVVVALRWGSEAGIAQLQPQIGESSDEAEFLIGEFRAAARAEGYAQVERVANLPFPVRNVITHRFRKQPNSWPLFQVGLGVFTTNQANVGYDWEPFAEVALQGLSILGKAFPGRGLAEAPNPQLELFYQDGFFFKDRQSASDFLETFPFYIKIPTPIVEQLTSDKTIHDALMSLSLKLSDPESDLVLRLTQGEINGKKGMILETTVRASGAQCPKLSDRSAVRKWLERAHEVQRTVFASVIKPAAAGKAH